jgi:hypothetical protein
MNVLDSACSPQAVSKLVAGFLACSGLLSLAQRHLPIPRTVTPLTILLLTVAETASDSDGIPYYLVLSTIKSHGKGFSFPQKSQGIPADPNIYRPFASLLHLCFIYVTSMLHLSKSPLFPISCPWD